MHLSRRRLALISAALIAAASLAIAPQPDAAPPEQPTNDVSALAATRPVTARLAPATTVPPTTTTSPPPPTTTTTHYHPPTTQPPTPPPTTQTPTPTQAHTASGSCGGWEDLISAYFPGEVNKACSVMMCESMGNPSAENRSSSASGLWQFLAGTWESVTGTPAPASQYSAETQTAAAAKLRNSSGWSQWSCN